VLEAVIIVHIDAVGAGDVVEFIVIYERLDGRVGGPAGGSGVAADFVDEIEEKSFVIVGVAGVDERLERFVGEGVSGGFLFEISGRGECVESEN
jgi:hypothetical protein